MQKTLTIKEIRHFENCLDKSSGTDPDCIIWMDNTIAFYRNDGYGNFKGMSAHIASYIYHYGPFNNKLLVRHTCSNKYCINPEHLRLGTHKDNIKDMFLQEESTTFLPVEKVRDIKTCIKHLQNNPDPTINHFYAIRDAVSLYCKVPKDVVHRILINQTYNYAL